MIGTGYSVLIPAYNAAATIRETLESVLSQTLPAGEIILVDDGSTDATAEIAASTPGIGPLRIHRQENLGPGAATTAAIALSAYPIIAMLDADDLWLPEKMQTQIAYLSENPLCSGVFAHMRSFRQDGLPLKGPAVNAGWSRITLAMHRHAACDIGAILDPPGQRGEMIDWFARARSLGMRLDMLDEVLALRRVHPGSISYGRDERDKGYARVAWLALQRRKGKAL